MGENGAAEGAMESGFGFRTAATAYGNLLPGGQKKAFRAHVSDMIQIYPETLMTADKRGDLQLLKQIIRLRRHKMLVAGYLYQQVFSACVP